MQRLLHQRDQLARVARLAQDGRYASRGRHVIGAGDDDDRDVARVGRRRHFTQDPIAAKLRQVQIEHHEIRVIGVDVFERGETVARHIHVEARDAERRTVHVRQHVVVFDYENASLRHGATCLYNFRSTGDRQHELSFRRIASRPGGKLAFMGEEDRRNGDRRDRRANPRGGRREGDRQKPWYMRRRLWLAAASVMFVAWRRVRTLGRTDSAMVADRSVVADDEPRYRTGLRR